MELSKIKIYNPAKSDIEYPKNILVSMYVYLNTPHTHFVTERLSQLQKLIDNELTEDQMKGLSVVLSSFTEREQKTIFYRFQQKKTLTETGELMCVTRERVRQILAKSFRKLNNQNNFNFILYGYDGYTQIDKEDREKHLNTDKEQFESNLDSISIDALGLTVRSYNCLKRAGIDTVGKLHKIMTNSRHQDELMRIRNLGKNSIQEVINKYQYFITPSSDNIEVKLDNIERIFKVTKEFEYPRNVYKAIESIGELDESLNEIISEPFDEVTEKNYNKIINSMYELDKKLIEAIFRDHVIFDDINIAIHCTYRKDKLKSVILMILRKLISTSNIIILTGKDIYDSENTSKLNGVEITLESYLSNLNLSSRCHNALERYGIKTVKELVDILENPKDSLVDIRNFGKGSYIEAAEKLVKLNLLEYKYLAMVEYDDLESCEERPIEYTTEILDRIVEYKELVKSKVSILPYPFNLLKDVIKYDDFLKDTVCTITVDKLMGLEAAIQMLTPLEQECIISKYYKNEKERDLCIAKDCSYSDIREALDLAIRKLKHPYRYNLIKDGLFGSKKAVYLNDINYIDIAEMDIDKINSIKQNLFYDLDKSFENLTLGKLKSLIEENPNYWFNKQAYSYKRLRLNKRENRLFIRYLISNGILEESILEKLK